MDENMFRYLIMGKPIEIVDGPNKGRRGRMSNPEILGFSDFKAAQVFLYADDTRGAELIIEGIENIEVIKEEETNVKGV